MVCHFGYTYLLAAEPRTPRPHQVSLYVHSTSWISCRVLARAQAATRTSPVTSTLKRNASHHQHPDQPPPGPTSLNKPHLFRSKNPYSFFPSGQQTTSQLEQVSIIAPTLRGRGVGAPTIPFIQSSNHKRENGLPKMEIRGRNHPPNSMLKVAKAAGTAEFLASSSSKSSSPTCSMFSLGVQSGTGTKHGGSRTPPQQVYM